jgi:hypothetical protein
MTFIRQRLYWLAHAPGQRLFREERADTAGIAAGVPGKRPEPDYREYHGRRISVEPGDVPLVDAIPSGMGFGEPELRRLVRSAGANQAGRVRAYGNTIVPELAAEFIRAAVMACNDIVDGGAMMSLSSPDKSEPEKLGIKIDPLDLSQAASTEQSGGGPDDQPTHAGSMPDAEIGSAPPSAGGVPQTVETCTRETLPGALGDISAWSDDALRVC